MKTILVTFFLLFSLSTPLLLEAADHASSPEQVFDISGGKVLIGPTYYILPVPTATCGPYGRCRSVGGLALASTREEPCHLDVVAVETYQGLPVIFHALSRKQAVVNISIDVNIQFYAETSCPQSTVWKLDDFDASIRQWFVTTGGALGSPGKKTVRNWFKIEKYDIDYKIVHCPMVCKHCKVQCSDIGIYMDENENKRLVLNDIPLKVRFQQA